MRGNLSPLMMIAGEGLLQNTGLSTNATLVANISSYVNSSPVAEYKQALSHYVNDRLERFAADTCPALTNAIPDGYTGIDPTDGSTEGDDRLTDVITLHSNSILGNGNLSKFAVQFTTADSFMKSSADMINSAATLSSYNSVTFDNFDSVITGNITNISLALNEFGTDLYNTGNVFSLSRLQHYGTPHSLIETLVDAGLLDFIATDLVSHGVNPDAIQLKLNELSDNEQLRPVIQKKCYDAFKTITDDKLAVIKQVLRVNNQHINTLADMLNTFKMFPSSALTLKSPTVGGFKAIYVNNTGSVNGYFTKKGQSNYSIMPVDVCDANAAFKQSLQQIKNVSDTNSIDLGSLIQTLETNYGLDLINSLTQPLPDSVYDYFTQSFASGSGENGQYYLSDFIGTPAGVTHNTSLDTVNSTISALNAVGALDNITAAFVILADMLNNVYGTPDGSTVGSIDMTSVGYGQHAEYHQAVDEILDDVETMISTLTSSYPTEVSSLNTSFDAMALQVQQEQSNLLLAGIVFDETPSTESSVLNLIQNLHLYAQSNEYQGPAEMLEKMADLTTQSGQALVAALREGRNLHSLSLAGIGTDAIPHNVTQPTETAELSSAKYSLTEAKNSIIIE